MSFYLAIDLGTTGCRSILFDDNLAVVSSSYEEYRLITPKEGWVEQDAELWWEMTLRTSEKAIKESGIDGKEISGISVSSQGITVVPVDEGLHPLCNAISWLDMRASEYAECISRDFRNDYIFKHTGKPITPGYTLPKLLWIRDNLRNDVWDKAYKFLMPLDFLIARFTGVCVTDHSMASGTLFYDIKNCCWSKEILDFYGIDENLLPEIRNSGKPVGNVLPEVAESLGLSSSCVVGVGAQDQKCAAQGAGLCDGTMTVSLGTAGAITKLWDEVKTDECREVGWCGYTEENSWVTEGVVNTAGTCLRWVRDMMFKGEGYDVINCEAAQAIERGSSLLFYPYLDEEACFFGANLATERGDFAAAVMEGVAFEIRDILEKMEADKDVRKLVLFGGGAKSDLWCQIIADITGKEIFVPTTAEAAGAGAAILAARAAGEKLSPLKTAKSYIPQRDYSEKYEKYKDIGNSIKGR